MKNSLTGHPIRSPKTAFRIIDGEAVVVVPEEGMVNIFNKVASRIWEILDGTLSLNDIAAVISSEFDATYETAYKDIEEFVEDLSKKGMVILPG